jgi:GntR family transcriptional regulator/MocR family aminotransferase
MAKLEVPFISIAVDRDSDLPLYRQVYDRLRASILAGEVPPGMRLPSTRTVASELGISRNTILNVYDQLRAEGFVEGRSGSGTRVATVLPVHLSTHSPAVTPLRMHGGLDILSRRGRVLAAQGTFATRRDAPLALDYGIPALDRFPLSTWARLIARHLRHSDGGLLDYADPAGYGPLREAIATYVSASRGVRCSPDQVVVVAGAQQALDLAARVLLNPGDTAWIEEPGYQGARAALLSNGVRLIPVPVGQAGLDVVEGSRRGMARLAYVTPAHQLPLGHVMSLQRRLTLLAWAVHSSAWLIEDDNDSEYRYDGHPIPTLFALDRDGVVIHIGTFAKTLFPSLRIGYLVVPPDLVDAFVSARAVAGWCCSGIEQAVLADFIAEGHLARHIRRMRSLYAERRGALVHACRRRLDGIEGLEVPPVGMHAVAWLDPALDDRLVAERARQYDVTVAPISDFHLEPAPRPGLVLGYAAVDPATIEDAVGRLAVALAEVKQERGSASVPG